VHEASVRAQLEDLFEKRCPGPRAQDETVFSKRLKRDGSVAAASAWSVAAPQSAVMANIGSAVIAARQQRACGRPELIRHPRRQRAARPRSSLTKKP